MMPRALALTVLWGFVGFIYFVMMFWCRVFLVPPGSKLPWLLHLLGFALMTLVLKYPMKGLLPRDPSLFISLAGASSAGLVWMWLTGYLFAKQAQTPSSILLGIGCVMSFVCLVIFETGRCPRRVSAGNQN